MHPTVLHEDSLLVSSDFPHFTRRHIVESLPSAIVVYHLGPCGNISPRYHVKDHTFDAAEQLGRRLGESVVRSLKSLTAADFRDNIVLDVARGSVDLVPNKFPSILEAEANLRSAKEHYQQLKAKGTPKGPLRTAECIVFGSEEGSPSHGLNARARLPNGKNNTGLLKCRFFGSASYSWWRCRASTLSSMD